MSRRSFSPKATDVEACFTASGVVAPGRATRWAGAFVLSMLSACAQWQPASSVPGRLDDASGGTSTANAPIGMTSEPARPPADAASSADGAIDAPFMPHEAAAPTAPAWPAPPPLPVGTAAAPLPLAEVLEGLLARLFADMQPGPNGPLPVVAFESFVDAGSGLQNRATVNADRLAPSIVRDRLSRHARVGPAAQALERSDWLVAGGLRLDAAVRAADGRPLAVPMCLALIDRTTGAVLGRQRGWVEASGLDLVPTSFYLDMPFVLPRPRALEADALCGDRPAVVSRDHLLQLPSLGLLDVAITSYDRGAWEAAAEAFRELAGQGGPAARMPLAGLYLSAGRLGQPAEAEQALRQLIELSLPLGPIAVNLLQPSVAPPGDDAAAPRLEALRMYARLVGNWEACVMLLGQRGVGGEIVAQKQAARRRAESVRRVLLRQGQLRASRVLALDAEPPQPLLGLGTDDPRDAWDRRVEMKLRNCAP